MRKKLEQYMIFPVFNREAHRAAHPNQTNDEDHAAFVAGKEKTLKELFQPISAIVAKHEGVMVNDGTGYKVAGHPYQHSQSMIVQVPPAAVEELKAVPNTNVVRFEHTTFNLPKTF